ncbi:MAG: LamG domain-containing protein [Gemmatales bacterium]
MSLSRCLLLSVSVLLPLIASAQPPIVGSLPTLAEGKFGKALDAKVSPVLVDGETAYRQPPYTVECWVKLFEPKYVNVIASCDPRDSAQHWSLRSESGTGRIEVHLPGYTPEYVHGTSVIADGQWHAAAFSFDGTKVKLYVDGTPAGEQTVTRQDKLSPKPGSLCIGMAIEGKTRITCNGLIDDIRISRTIREITKAPTEPAPLDPLTVGLWTFDKVDQLAGDPAWTPRPSSGTFPDWEKAQEKEWVDDRFREMKTGPSFNATFQYPSWTGKEFVHKGTALRLGEKGEAAVIFDRAQLRYVCGWTGGYLQHSNVRFGLLNTPKPVGTIAFANSPVPGWANADGKFSPVPPRTTALPIEWGRFRGLYLSGNRPVLDYDIGDVRVLDAPWFTQYDSVPVFTRKIVCTGKIRDKKLLIAEVAGANFKKVSFPGALDLWVAERETHTTAVSVTIPVGSKLDGQSGQLLLEIPAEDDGCAVEVYLWSGQKTELPAFSKMIGRAAPELPKITPLMKGGAKRWGEPLITKGEVAPNDKPLVIDILTIPYDNPHNALFFCTGIDMLPNGDLAMCTVHGDVWLIKGADDKLNELRWHRFATGLYHPLGLKVVNGVIHVLERGQITKLHDLNNDGEADYYECLTNAWHTGTGEHSYDSNLETDPQGRFYFFKTGDSNLPHGGTLLRCNVDGSNVEVYCTGFRHPMALSVSPMGQVTGSDQEGNWIPSTRVDYFKQGGFYGFMPGHHRAVQPTTYDPPVCWMPRSLDNSAGGESWIPDNLWGSLGGQLLHLSYGRCRIQYVLPPQRVDGALQTGAVDLGLKFLSGIMRGRFHPIDHHFYVCGLNGWQTAAVRDGCLQRVRRTDKPLLLPMELAAHTKGMMIKFSQPLDPDTASDVRRYGFSQWNYRYSGDYGSKFWSVTQPNREGTDTLKVTKATLQSDGCSVFLEIPHLRPAMQCQLTYDVRTKDQTPLSGDLYHTIYKLAP